MAPTKSRADVEAIDDLCSLESCTDQTVLEHLELRWRQGLPYTQLGGIVVAVNPHKWLDIYSDGRNGHAVHKTCKDSQCYPSCQSPLSCL
jgi:myosin heavy subunit